MPVKEAPSPPSNQEAEQSVLGAILARPQVMDDIADQIKPVDFYREAHGRIFQAIMDLYAKNEPIDLVTVTALLKERGQLEGVGGPVFLMTLTEQVGFSVNAPKYAKIVAEKATLRRLLEATQTIAGACLAPVENLAEFLDEAENMVFSVVDTTVRPGFKGIGPLAVAEYNALEQIFERKEMLTGVPSGFKDLDNLTAGFQNSDLIIVAARPSMGKTALALNIAHNAAKRTGTPVGFFSLEMSEEQLTRRQLSSSAMVDANNLRRAFLAPAEWEKLQIAVDTLQDLPLYIDDTPGATVMDIRSKCRRLRKEGKLGLVVIDYLQLMRGRGQNREREISEISRSLKALAKELNIPVIALSQLSRKCEERPDKRPQLSDLRESGAIEQDADLVLFVYRDELYNKESLDKGLAEIIVGKQRNGPIGMVKLQFQGRFTRFDSTTTMEVGPERRDYHQDSLDM